MKILRGSILCILALSLIACGEKSKKTEFFGVEEKAKKPKVTTTTKLVRNWRSSLGSGFDAGGATISPILLGDFVYAASPDGKVDKISADTGKRVWRAKLKKQSITAGVDVGGGLVLAGTDEGVVYAFNQLDGEIAWQRQLSSEILASPVIENDIVVARTGDGKVYGLAAYDGDVLWTISRQLPKLTLRGDSKPLVYGGVVFTGFSDGTLAALEASNGRALWDFPISFARGSSEIDRLSDIDTNPLLVSNYIYVSSYQDITHALNIQEQRIEWSTDVSSYNSLAYDAAHLYISDKQGVVHQIDRSNGNKLWSQNGLRLFSVSAPISVGPFVLVSEGDGNLYVMDKNSGAFLGKHSLGANTIIGEAVVDSDTVYLMDSGGSVQSFSITPKG